MRFGQVTEAKEYSYVNTRIKARKGQLLTAADYEQLLISTLNEGFTYLQSNPRYKELFSALDQDSSNFSQKLEKLLQESVYKEIITLASDIPAKARELIMFYLKRVYIDTLKYLLRLIYSKETTPFSSEDFFVTTLEEKTELALIFRSESIESLINNLQTPWIVEALKSVLPEYNKQKNIFLLEHALDQSYYRQLWDVLIPSQNKRDGKMAQQIIGMEIDLINLNIVLRSKVLKLPPDEIRSQLMLINYRLGSALNLAVKTSSFSDTIDILQTTAYSDLVRAIYRDYKEKDESIANMEQLQEEWFIQSLHTLLAGYPFHIGIFLSYIIFRFQEIKNLRIIFESKWKKIDLKLARELLIYFR